MRGIARQPGLWWGDILVAGCACLLTVAILGSGVYLTWKMMERRAVNASVRSFVSSLQNRTPAELEERVAQLRVMPKVARYVMPEIRRTLREANSEQQMGAAIQIARAFIDDRSMRKALFRLRNDEREAVAAAAVEALSRMSPPEQAATTLGECLISGSDVPVSPAVVDEVCAGLIRLGAVGRAEMERRLASLSVDRRVWLARYLKEADARDRGEWLELLRADADPTVRSAAEDAGRPYPPVEEKELSTAQRG
jgi:hypothetical protein